MTTLLLNKPYGVICQFSGDGEHRTLAEFVPLKNVYPAGRLDTDSEGLVILTDDGRLQNRISHPLFKKSKSYWVQVEHVPEPSALERLRSGILLKDGPALPVTARMIAEPAGLWPRDPPIRRRLHIPTAWLELTLTQGRNRQVRRMTAAIGCPTLRLIRWRIGDWTIAGLRPGEWREVAAFS
ncbi:MAG: pseudouridine synthase [Gammaproteobacteria bacterium]|nr:pseudouridine synthase [Gammaproteobacteria bacterium]MDE2346398.1 pseudouridine synthase [Gammaproteobacteria bacterium]